MTPDHAPKRYSTTVTESRFEARWASWQLATALVVGLLFGALLGHAASKSGGPEYAEVAGNVAEPTTTSPPASTITGLPATTETPPTTVTVPVADPPPTAPPVPMATTHPPATLLRLTGEKSRGAPLFTTTQPWSLTYSFNNGSVRVGISDPAPTCSFSIRVVAPDGSSSLPGITGSGRNGRGTQNYEAIGTYRLDIQFGCTTNPNYPDAVGSWSLAVQG